MLTQSFLVNQLKHELLASGRPEIIPTVESAVTHQSWARESVNFILIAITSGSDDRAAEHVYVIELWPPAVL
jgi:hypothetical protein